MSNAAIVTTFNEEQSIGQLVTRLIGHGFTVFVVDDLSTDNTLRNAIDAGAKVYQTTGHVGIGPCLMRGWKYAIEAGCTRLMQLDAGGSHDPDEAKRMVDALATTNADIVIGSRFMRGSVYDNSHGRRGRPEMSRAAAVACNLATSAHYTDWTSGMRAFTAGAARELLDYKYFSKMHGWQIEVLARANAIGMRIDEWPIKYVAGRSSFNWRVAHEASNAWLHVFFHVGGCTSSKRLYRQRGVA